MSLNILRSNKGNTLLIAMMIAFGLMATSTFYASLSQSNNQSVQLLKLQNRSVAFENRIKTALMQPGTYICVRSGVSKTSEGTLKCDLNVANFMGYLKDEIKETKANYYFKLNPDASSAGFFIRPTDSGGSPFFYKVQTEISVENPPAEIASLIKAKKFAFSVPIEVMQDLKNVCPESKPIFSGFTSDGNIKCNAVSAPCALGYYISKVDPKTMQTTCSLMPSVGCGSNQIMSDFTYDGGSSFTPICMAKADPNTYWPVGKAPGPQPTVTPTATPTVSATPSSTPTPTPTVIPSPTATPPPTVTAMKAGCFVDTTAYDYVDEGYCESDQGCTTTNSVAFSAGDSMDPSGDGYIFSTSSDFTITWSGGCTSPIGGHKEWCWFQGVGNGTKNATAQITRISTGETWTKSVTAVKKTRTATNGKCGPLN